MRRNVMKLGVDRHRDMDRTSCRCIYCLVDVIHSSSVDRHRDMDRMSCTCIYCLVDVTPLLSC